MQRKIIRYRIYDWQGYFKFVSCGNGLKLVDPNYIDEFKCYFAGAEFIEVSEAA
jgi:hypothetical protein